MVKTGSVITSMVSGQINPAGGSADDFAILFHFHPPNSKNGFFAPVVDAPVIARTAFLKRHRRLPDSYKMGRGLFAGISLVFLIAAVSLHERAPGVSHLSMPLLAKKRGLRVRLWRW